MYEVGRRSDISDQRYAIGDTSHEAGGWRQEVGGRRSETGGWRQEVGDRRSDILD